jgi:hypothetical protein
MKAIVVYESLWGNTAAVGRAIAEGLGPEALALSTAEAADALTAGADLIVAGGPVHAFSLTTEQGRANLAKNPGRAPTPPDLSHPSLRLWLDSLAPGHAYSAAFDTRMKWTPGGAAAKIERRFGRAGYRRLAKGKGFVVAGSYGPLREGELQRAREWGAELARALASAPAHL